MNGCLDVEMLLNPFQQAIAGGRAFSAAELKEEIVHAVISARATDIEVKVFDEDKGKTCVMNHQMMSRLDVEGALFGMRNCYITDAYVRVSGRQTVLVINFARKGGRNFYAF